MKKGQMEMVGLAVIVIILVLAFVLFLTLNRGQDISAVTARESLYANNLLNAVMLYSLDEGSIRDYIQECYDASMLVDTVKINLYCNETKGEIELVIQKLLKANQNYEISFEGYCGQIKIGSLGGCGDEYITASPYYIRTKGGNCKVQLKLC